MDPETPHPNHDGPNHNSPVHLRVEHVYPALLAIAMARLRDVDAAEDLAQEVVVRGLLRIDQLRDPARLEAWLIGAARHLAANWQRDATRRERSLHALAELLPRDNASHPKVRAMIDQQTHQQILEESLAGMDDADREIVMLHFVAGMPKNRIAETLGVHPATVGRRLEKAIDHLKSRALAKLGDSLRADTASPARRQRLRQASLAVLALESTRQSALAAELDAIETLPASFAVASTSGTFAGLAATLTSVPAIIAGVCAALLITTAVVVNIAPTTEAQPPAPATPSVQTGSGTSSSNAISLAAPSPAEPRRATRVEEDDIDALLANIPVSEPMRAFIEGRFTDEEGNAVANAEVRLHHLVIFLMGKPARVTRTSPDGSYSFDQVLPGMYLLEGVHDDQASRVGHPLMLNVGPESHPGDRRDPRSIVGDHADDVDIRHFPSSGIVHGMLFDSETEEPIANARLRRTYLLSNNTLGSFTTTTDEDGSWMFEGFQRAAGPAIVIESPDGRIGVSLVAEEVESPVVLELHRRVNQPIVHLDESERDVSGDIIALLVQDNDMPLMTLPVLEDSTIRAPSLPDGRYELIIMVQNGDELIIPVSHAFRVEESQLHPTGVTIRLPQKAFITGIVRDYQTLDPVGDAVVLSRGDSTSTLALMNPTAVRVDDMGRFRIPVLDSASVKHVAFVNAERYEHIPLMPGSGLKRTKAGNWDARIPRAPTVTGKIIRPDGSPVQGAEVFAFTLKDGQAGMAQMSPSVHLGEDGHFEIAIRGLGLGNPYALIATADGLAGFVTGTTEADVNDYEQDIVVHEAEPITILVKDTDGELVRNAEVRVSIGPKELSPQYPPHTLKTEVHADGTLRGWMPRDWHIRAMANRNNIMERAEYEHEVYPHETGGVVELMLKSPDRKLEGIVVDSEGAPVAEAFVHVSTPVQRVTTSADGGFEILVEGDYAYLRVNHEEFNWTNVSIPIAEPDGEPIRVTLYRKIPLILNVRHSDGQPYEGLATFVGAAVQRSAGQYPRSGWTVEHGMRIKVTDGLHQEDMAYQVSQGYPADQRMTAILVTDDGLAGFAEGDWFQIGHTEPIVLDVVLDDRRLSGRVIDRVTKRPIPDAVVQTNAITRHEDALSKVSGQKPFFPADVTDAQGHFTLESLAGIEQRVWASHPEYGTRNFDVDLASHLRGRNLVLELNPVMTIGGEVRDHRGRAFTNWQFVTAGPNNDVRPAQWRGASMMGNHPSRRLGAYLIENIPREEFHLSLAMPGPGQLSSVYGTTLQWLVVPPVTEERRMEHDIAVPQMYDVSMYSRRPGYTESNRWIRYRLTRTTGQDPRVILNPPWSQEDDETQHFHTLLAPPGEYRVEIQEQVGNDWNTIETGQTVLIGEGIEVRLMPEEVRERLEKAE